MSGYWLHRTNHGRVIYRRKQHLFSQRDVDRIVRNWAMEQEPEVLMMSQLADRMLWWLARRLGLDEIARWTSSRLGFLFAQLQFPGLDAPEAPSRAFTQEDLFEWVANQAGGGSTESRSGALLR